MLPLRRATRRLCALIVAGVCIACSRGPDALTPAEQALGREVGIPDSLVLLLRAAGSDLRRLTGEDTFGNRRPALGLTVALPERRAEAAVTRLRDRFGPGYVVFRSERNFGHEPDRIAVLRSGDGYEALRVMHTNGWNHGIGPDSLIRHLQRWDERHGLRLRGAALDWVELEIVRPPADLAALAREVYALCPDVVTQGTETVARLAAEMRRTRTLYCWWD